MSIREDTGIYSWKREFEIPARISAEQEGLLRQLAELEETEVAPERKSWMDSIKEFFSGTEEDQQ